MGLPLQCSNPQRSAHVIHSPHRSPKVPDRKAACRRKARGDYCALSGHSSQHGVSGTRARPCPRPLLRQGVPSAHLETPCNQRRESSNPFTRPLARGQRAAQAGVVTARNQRPIQAGGGGSARREYAGHLQLAGAHAQSAMQATAPLPDARPMAAERRGMPKNRPGIRKRPKGVITREQTGHWEAIR